MPAVQYNYDYYEYARPRRGTVNSAPRVSASKNSTTAKKRSSSRVASPSKIELKTKTTRDITRAATRAATHDEYKKHITSRKMEKPKEMTLKKPKVSAKKNVKTKKNIVKKVALSFALFSALFLICYRSSLINESFNQLGSVKNKLEDTKTLNAQIESEIQTQTDLAYIESYAKYQLGMQKPKNSQIQKIVIAKEDKISTPVVIDEEEKNFFERLWNDFLNVID